MLGFIACVCCAETTQSPSQMKGMYLFDQENILKKCSGKNHPCQVIKVANDMLKRLVEIKHGTEMLNWVPGEMKEAPFETIEK